MSAETEFLREHLEKIRKIAAEGATHPSDVIHLRRTIMAMASTATVALHKKWETKDEQG